MIALNLSQASTPAERRTALTSTDCPKCRAPKEKRITASGFGTHKAELCRECGHDFKENSR